MAWKSDARLIQACIIGIDAAKAFRAGYSDGHLGYPMWSGNERDYHPDAYKRGYHYGRIDRSDSKDGVSWPLPI